MVEERGPGLGAEEQELTNTKMLPRVAGHEEEEFEDVELCAFRVFSRCATSAGESVRRGAP